MRRRHQNLTHRIKISFKIQLVSLIFIQILTINHGSLVIAAATSCDSSSCQECQTQDGLVSCKTCLNPSYKILENGCVSTCPTYTKEQSGVCKQICHNSCASCDGNDYFNCLTCRDNRELQLSNYFQYGECNCKYSYTDDLTPTCEDSSTASIMNTIVFSLALISLIAMILLSLIEWSGFILYYFIDSLQCSALLYYINYKNSYQFDDILYYLDKANISSTLKPDWYRGESNYNKDYQNWKVAKHINSSNFALEQIIVIIFLILLWIVALLSVKYYQMKSQNNEQGNKFSQMNNRKSNRRTDRINKNPTYKSNHPNGAFINSANSSLNISIQQRSLSQIQEEQVEEDQTRNIKNKNQEESQRDINDISSRNSRNNLFRYGNSSNQDRNNLNSQRNIQQSMNQRQQNSNRKHTFNLSKSSLNSIVIYDSNDPGNFRFSKGMNNRETSEGNKISQRSSQINSHPQNKLLPEQYYHQNNGSSHVSQKKQIKLNKNESQPIIEKDDYSNKNPFSISVLIFFFMITNQETLIVLLGQFNYSFTFKEPGTAISTGFCLLMIAYMCGFLLYLFKKLLRNKIKQSNQLQSDYNTLYYLIDNYNQERVYQRCYFAISFIRKFISSVACSLLHVSPLLQIIIILINQAVYLIYLMAAQPIKNNQEKYLIFLVHSEVLLCYIFQTIIVSKDTSQDIERESVIKYTEGLIFIVIILLLTFLLYSFYILIKWLTDKCRQCNNQRKKKTNNNNNNKKEKTQVHPERVLVPVEVPVEQPKEEVIVQVMDDSLKKKVQDLEQELLGVKARQDSIDKLQILEVREEKDLEDSQFNGKLIIYEDSSKNPRNNIQDESFRDDLEEDKKLLKSQSIQVNSKMFESSQYSTILPPPSQEKKKRYVQSRQTQVNMDKELKDNNLLDSAEDNSLKQSITYESVIEERSEEDSEIKKNKVYKTQDIQVDSTCFDKPKKVVEAQVQTTEIPKPKMFKDQAINTNSKLFGADDEDEEDLIQFTKQKPPQNKDFSSQTQPIEIKSPLNQNKHQMQNVVDQPILDQFIKQIQDQEIPKLNQDFKDSNQQKIDVNKEKNNPLKSTISIQTSNVLEKPQLINNHSNNSMNTPVFSKFLENHSPKKQTNYTHNKVIQKKSNPGIKWNETNKFDKYFNGTEMHSKINQQRSRVSSLNNTLSNDQLSVNSNIYLGQTTPQHNNRHSNDLFQEIEMPNSARSNYKKNNEPFRNNNTNTIFSRGAQNSLQTLALENVPSRTNNIMNSNTPSYHDRMMQSRQNNLKSNVNNFFSSQSPRQSKYNSDRSHSNILSLQPMPTAFDKNSKLIN